MLLSHACGIVHYCARAVYSFHVVRWRSLRVNAGAAAFVLVCPPIPVFYVLKLLNAVERVLAH